MVEPITLAVEGPTDAAVLERVIRDADLATGPQYIKNGKDALDRSLVGYNNAARFSPWLVLRDLNSDEECAPALRARLLPKPARRMFFHVAVRALEAWLLADAEAFGRFLAVPGSCLPVKPEEIERPKLEIVNLARRSRRRSVREALVPAADSTAKVGPGYAALITEFAAERWRPRVAAGRSPSLERLLRHLEGLRGETT